MTTFSLAVLCILILLLAARYRQQICTWISALQKSKHTSRNGPANDPSDLKCMAPYPVQPIKGRERYRVMMDIRKMDAQNWLTLDKNYMEEHRVRDHLLREKRDQVLRCLPESVEACQEALEAVSTFLCERFPNTFRTTVHEKEKFVRNCMTGEEFRIDGAAPGKKPTDALEAAVRLTMEDLSILMRNEEGEYYLYGILSSRNISNNLTDHAQRGQCQSLPHGMDCRRTHRMDNLPPTRTSASVASTRSQFRQQASQPSSKYRTT